MTASKIEWTGRSDWNPVRGCSRVTEACRNCYAEIMAARFSDPGQWGHGFAHRISLPGGETDHRWTGKVELQLDRLTKPLHWRKSSLVFPNSTSDFFHEKLLFSDIDKLHAVMALTPHLTYQILTKRPARAREYYSDPSWFGRVTMAIDDLKLSSLFNGNTYEAKRALSYHVALPNIWLGTSVHDQASANEFIPELLLAPVALRFISAEPLLGPINLGEIEAPEKVEGERWTFDALMTGDYYTQHGEPGEPTSCGDGPHREYKLDWVIAGGESGKGARPMHPAWPMALRDQCQAANVPFFFKQWGSCLPCDWDGDNGRGGIAYNIEEEHSSIDYDDLGKAKMVSAHGREFAQFSHKNTGRLLDGKTYSEFPPIKAAAS